MTSRGSGPHDKNKETGKQVKLEELLLMYSVIRHSGAHHLLQLLVAARDIESQLCLALARG